MTSPREQPTPFEPTPPQEIFAAYTWSTGHLCYRCGRGDVETTPIGRLMSNDAALDVPACPSCVLLLERQRETAAHRYGWTYQPGTPVDHR